MPGQTESMEAIKPRFLEFFQKNKTRKFAICTHRKADLDTFTSAYALSLIMPNSILCTPDEPNNAVRNLLEKWDLKLPLIGSLDRKQYAGLIVLDTSAYTLLEEARNWGIRAIIDHHRAEGRDMIADYHFVDEHSPATAEIMANILPEISPKAAYALALGIISDTARFKSSRQSTFTSLARMMEICKAPYSELLGMAEPEVPSDLKIAVLKAIQRLEYKIIGTYVVVTSEVGAGESDASGLLSDIADVVFIASWKDETQLSHVSSRARKHVKPGLHEVMRAVAVRFGGNGGGHPKAAGAAVKAHTKEALEACLEELGKRI